MNETCPKCGLPKDLCICQEISKAEEKIKIYTEKKKFGKISTILKGFSENKDLHMLAKEFKKKLACGGTGKNKRIELQGDHREKVKKMLLKMNYTEGQIEVY